MAHWTPTAANDLMAFAANHGLTPLVGAFQNMVDNWANALPGHANASFPFGNYQAEVAGDTGQVLRIQFDM
ncbi:hypothetical protein D3C76_790850 [compost metagenome]|jgi:hypothetical protein|uniref:hypothetical protein n=1 Tax=Pseudomonas TaxID=286 RepID=UPI0004D3F2C5|nr:hypothetical protein [Pseudomonas sp. G5(2012)]KEX89405.1 hypothetical protein HA62_05370 [Pseudomonas putida]